MQHDVLLEVPTFLKHYYYLFLPGQNLQTVLFYMHRSVGVCAARITTDQGQRKKSPISIQKVIEDT